MVNVLKNWALATIVIPLALLAMALAIALIVGAVFGPLTGMGVFGEFPYMWLGWVWGALSWGFLAAISMNDES